MRSCCVLAHHSRGVDRSIGKRFNLGRPLSASWTFSRCRCTVEFLVQHNPYNSLNIPKFRRLDCRKNMKAFWLTVTMTFILSKCSATELNSNSSQSYYQNNCDPATMVVYRMSLVTNWTEELFPKSYPKWRPPAQWSQVFGTFDHY